MRLRHTDHTPFVVNFISCYLASPLWQLFLNLLNRGRLADASRLLLVNHTDRSDDGVGQPNDMLRRRIRGIAQPACKLLPRFSLHGSWQERSPYRDIRIAIGDEGEAVYRPGAGIGGRVIRREDLLLRARQLLQVVVAAILHLRRNKRDIRAGVGTLIEG